MGAILQVHLLMDPNVSVISANTFLLHLLSGRIQGLGSRSFIGELFQGSRKKKKKKKKEKKKMAIETLLSLIL